MTTPEGKIKDKVKQLLKSHKIYWFCPVQYGLGASGLDFFCCHKGFFFVVETKAPGKKATKRQEYVMGRVRDAGGECFVIDGPESMKELEKWILSR